MTNHNEFKEALQLVNTKGFIMHNGEYWTDIMRRALKIAIISTTNTTQQTEMKDEENN